MQRDISGLLDGDDNNGFEYTEIMGDDRGEDSGLEQLLGDENGGDDDDNSVPDAFDEALAPTVDDERVTLAVSNATTGAVHVVAEGEHSLIGTERPQTGLPEGVEPDVQQQAPQKE